MGKRAIISDIHGNIEALTAVLADIEAQGISEIYCLGDVIGYGPNPRECSSGRRARTAKMARILENPRAGRRPGQSGQPESSRILQREGGHGPPRPPKPPKPLAQIYLLI